MTIWKILFIFMTILSAVLHLDYKKHIGHGLLDFYQMSSERDIEEYCQVLDTLAELDISTLELSKEIYCLDLNNLTLKEVFFLTFIFTIYNI